MNFTKKHEEWSLFFGLRPSTRLIWSCIIGKTRGDRSYEIEIDLIAINKWVAKKRGKPYDRKTIKLAIAQLEERSEGLIVVMKKYSWHCYKLLVRPLSFLCEKKSQESEKVPNSSGGNPQFSDVSRDREVQQQQQSISKIDKLLREVGLRFDSEALVKIWQLSGKCIDRVTQTIELMLYRNCSTPIARPHGFVIDCLRQGWSKGFDIFYQPELPKFNCVGELRQYVSNLKINLATG